MNLKKISTVFLAAAMLVSFAGCGAVKSAQDSEAPQSMEDYYGKADSAGLNTSYSQGIFKPGTKLEEDYVSEGDSMSSDRAASYLPSDVKLIYRANANAQTENFDDAEQKLKAAVLDAGGYFESQNLYSGGFYNSGALRSGEYTVRIPAEKYREFVDAMSAYAVVTSLKETVEDVGQIYHETEVRLKTLYAKEERLQELLRKAADLNDIIQLENALSDTEYQIDMYGSALNRYDSLISFATVNITLQEVSRPDTGIGEKNGFFAVLGKRFMAGLADTGRALENFAYWISGNFVPLVLCAGAAVLVIRKHPLRRIRDKIAAGRAEKAKNSPEDENK